MTTHVEIHEIDRTSACPAPPTTAGADTALATVIPDEKLILRAICDPGSFLPRGEYNGEPYGESIQHWSMRAVLEVVRQGLVGRLVVEQLEPHEGEFGEHWWDVHDAGEVSYYRQDDDGSVQVETPYDDDMTPDEAEHYGVVLVTAAHAARQLATKTTAQPSPGPLRTVGAT